MRERAEGATPGPWDEPDYLGIIRAGYGSPVDGELVHGEDCGCGGGILGENDAAHIASWHPAVALAVALLLDNEANAWDAQEARASDDFPDLSVNHARRDLLTAVAEAYLGTGEILGDD